MKTEPHFHLSRRSFLQRTAPSVLGATAMSNCLRDLILLDSAMAFSTPTDYKALVCVFLGGGNDANNLIIPTAASEYANYATVRTPVLALPNADGSPAKALQLTTSGGGNYIDAAGHEFGLNPAMFEIAQMFNQNSVGGYDALGAKAAVVLNSGPLVFPMTKAQYLANSIKKPPQLFSHADQVTQWQTSIPDQPPSTGWGGRIADLVHSANPKQLAPNDALDVLATCITIAGANTFQIGQSVQQYAMGTGGVVSLANPSNPSTAATARDTALRTILGIGKANVNEYTNNYAKALDGTIAAGQGLSTALTASPMAAYYSTVANWSKTGTAHQVVTPNGGTTFTSSLMQQLKMVAQIIEASSRKSTANSGLGMKRQIFFVTVGGYDTHTGQTNNPSVNGAPPATNDAAVVIGSQANLLAEVSQSVHSFMKAMQAIGVQQQTTAPGSGLHTGVNSVTCFTASDFNRTFKCNGLGSDHSWGSHHLVIGGAVNGRQTYGTFPNLTINGPDDTGGVGSWIPTTSVDQYAATLSKWFGLSHSELTTVFPNLTRFSGTYAGGYLGFMA